MKTFLNNTKQIDDFLAGRLSGEEAVLFEAQLLLDNELQDAFHWQKHTYVLVQNYARKKLKEEIEVVHQQLFRQERYMGFRNRIASIFSK